MTDDLIQIASETNMTLLILTDTIIREFKDQISTLNLIFVTTEVTHKLMSCMMI